MPVPDFQSLMLPVLKALKDGREVRVSEVRRRVATTENLTDDDQKERIPSGRMTRFANRISWALDCLGKAGLVKRIEGMWGVWQLTTEGKKLLNNPPSRVDLNYLRENYPAFAATPSASQAARDVSSSSGPTSASLDSQMDTPEEALMKAASQLREALEIEVLDRVRKESAAFFERVVVDLLIAMGYGGGDPERGKVMGRPGDGGIDGTIKQDALGFDEVHVQAKRYTGDNTVGEVDLRSFVGALDTKRTTKGVFVTTANFTRAAREFVKSTTKHIVLIDGQELARLMVQYNVGVRKRDSRKIEIRQLDESYFAEE